MPSVRLKGLHRVRVKLASVKVAAALAFRDGSKGGQPASGGMPRIA